MDKFGSLRSLDDLAALQAATRELCAEARENVATAQRLRLSLSSLRQRRSTPIFADVTPPALFGDLLTRFLATSIDPYRFSKEMVDVHGRRARHIAAAHALACRRKGDAGSERFWLSIFNTIREIQVSPFKGKYVA